ncbi:MAG: outer membrane protein assembly factor BamD [Campylobacteraceae bacterium]
MNLKTIALAILCAFIFFGCADKSAVNQYNQPASFWYDEMIKAIADGDLEKANNLYSSLSSEHVASPLLREALLILAQAHIDDEDYVEANKYLDEYVKRFGNSQRNEYVKYLKIKANYSSFSRPNRNQQLILNTIADTKKFVQEYPNSSYRPMVEAMLVHMELGERYIDENIAKLYSKLGKENAAKYYQDKIDDSDLVNTDVVEPRIPWYRKWFEW